MKDALARHAVGLTACTRCPRLVAYRAAVAGTKKAFANDVYWSRPVPGFGDADARIVLVGLAPAPHGANRTGRMFTGDGTDGMGSSDFLMRALRATGFANRDTSRAADDGLRLTDLWMTAAVRCAPPDNKPSPAEIANCAPWLASELELLPRVRVVVALGKLAFDRVLLHFAERGAAVPRPRPRFAHGAEVVLAGAFPLVIASYHPSRQNTQTGLLLPSMLADVFRRAKTAVTSARGASPR
jgi:uracil-DNA glycosylase family 4